MVHGLRAVCILLIVLLAAPLQAAPQYSFKIASLAPEGSLWINHFREFAREVEQKTNGEVEMKVYPGGVMGDDLAMYRKLRAGQLHGGGFTMTGIATVVPDFRVMAIPFFLHTYQEVDALTEALTPAFARQFQEKGLELVAMTEVGFIYSMSTMPTPTIDDLRRRKSWIPEGDPLTAAFLDNLGVNPIPLSIPDVLSSLQTGLIDTVYSSLYGSIVMQWFTKARYITDIPYGYAYGAIVFSKKALSQLPPSHAEILRAAADTHFAALNRQIRTTNIESRKVLEENGAEFIAPSAEMTAELEATRKETIPQVLGSSFSREIFTQASEALEKVRKTR